jgi:hypothetical protein
MTARGGTTRRAGAAFLGVALALWVAPSGARAQSLAERVAAVRDGKVRMSYATRPEVCGNGRNINIERSNGDWESDCEHGPARLQLEWRGGELVDVDTYVGGRWRAGGADVTDLGTVPTAAVADCLLGLARRAPGRVADKLIFPATIADSVTVWPQLLEIARDSGATSGLRKSAVFWLGQAAGAAVADDLGGIVADAADVEIQDAAVFALSQLRDGAGVPSLLTIARTHHSAKVRRTAMFWLAQSKDPRAVALFEEILNGH